VEGEEEAVGYESAKSNGAARYPSALKATLPVVQSSHSVLPATESYAKRRLSVMEDMQREKQQSVMQDKARAAVGTVGVEHPELARAERVMLRGMKAALKEREVAVKERAMITLILIREGDTKLKRRFFRIWRKGAEMQKYSSFLESHAQRWQMSCAESTYCLGYKRYHTSKFVLPSAPALLAASFKTRHRHRHHHHHHGHHEHHHDDHHHHHHHGHHNHHHHHHHGDVMDPTGHAYRTTYRTKETSWSPQGHTTKGWQRSLPSLPAQADTSRRSLTTSLPSLVGQKGAAPPALRRDFGPEQDGKVPGKQQRARLQDAHERIPQMVEMRSKKSMVDLAPPEEVVHFRSGQRTYLDVNTMQILRAPPPQFVPYAAARPQSG